MRLRGDEQSVKCSSDRPSTTHNHLATGSLTAKVLHTLPLAPSRKPGFGQNDSRDRVSPSPFMVEGPRKTLAAPNTYGRFCRAASTALPISAGGLVAAEKRVA